MQTEIEGHIDMMDIANELVVIPKAVIDIFLKSDEPADLISLYTFYYHTAKWQRTNRIKATTGYCAKGLHWGEDRVRRAKKQLIDIGLVYDVRTIDKDTHKASGWYIQITYIMKNSNVVEHLKATLPPNPECGIVQSVEVNETNALSSNTLNALSSNKLPSSETDSGKENFKLFKDHLNNILKRNNYDAGAYAWGAFNGSAKRLIKVNGLTALKSALDKFENDEWCKNNGYPFTAFLKKMVVYLKPTTSATPHITTYAEMEAKNKKTLGT
jgi:hypothetical protein